MVDVIQAGFAIADAEAAAFGGFIGALCVSIIAVGKAQGMYSRYVSVQIAGRQGKFVTLCVFSLHLSFNWQP